MSVRITSFAAAAGRYSVWHDELNHGGDVDPTTIVFATNPDGSTNRDVVGIACPSCPGVSFHPVAGGADADGIERLFAYLLMSRVNLPAAVAAALGVPAAPPRSWADAKAIVKAAVTRIEGPGRWRLETVAQGQ
jgi:hypothetical protein